MYKKHRYLLIGLCVLAISLILVRISAITNFDQHLSFFFYNTFHNNAVTYFLTLITDYTLGSIVGAILVFLFILVKGHLKTALVFILSFLSLNVIRYLIMIFIARQRPFEVNTAIHYLGRAEPFGLSFPSGHATQAFFLAFFLTATFKTKKTVTILIYSIAILVLISRVYLGAHYLLDVFAGATLGLIWGYISYTFFHKQLDHKPLR